MPPGEVQGNTREAVFNVPTHLWNAVFKFPWVHHFFVFLCPLILLNLVSCPVYGEEWLTWEACSPLGNPPRTTWQSKVVLATLHSHMHAHTGAQPQSWSMQISWEGGGILSPIDGSIWGLSFSSLHLNQGARLPNHRWIDRVLQRKKYFLGGGAD